MPWQIPERQTPERQTPKRQTPESQTPERQTPDKTNSWQDKLLTWWPPENLKFFLEWNVIKFINFVRKIWKCSAENPKNGPERFLGEIQNKVD